MPPDIGLNTALEIASKYGIGALVVIVLCIISYRIIRHVLVQSDKILQAAMDMNAKWQKVIDDHTSSEKEFHNMQKEANNYVREEHKEMLQGLQDVCVITKQHSECMIKIKDNLEEQGKVLIRINGIKKD